MTPNGYQDQANRTICPQPTFEPRGQVQIGASLSNVSLVDPAMLLHATVGISGEAGELSTAIERWAWYGKSLDLINVKEELGDLLWYVAEACKATGFTMSSLMEANIRKLRARYPERYTDEAAAEENRNRAKEADAVISETK